MPTDDVILGWNVDTRRGRRDATSVWGDTLYYLRWVDGLFVDPECCLSDRGEPWSRTHPPFRLRANPGWAAPTLDAAGDFVDGYAVDDFRNDRSFVFEARIDLESGDPVEPRLYPPRSRTAR